MSEPRFLADVMLGSLARWLRILGYDTVYDNRIPDLEIVKRALGEDRLVLSRDRRLCRRKALADRHLLIESQRLDGQLLQVLQFLEAPLPARLARSRCVRCNGELAPLKRAAARGRVPSYVWRTQQRFKECAGCRRVYWSGTHQQRMLQRLRRFASAAGANLQSPRC